MKESTMLIYSTDSFKVKQNIVGNQDPVTQPYASAITTLLNNEKDPALGVHRPVWNNF